MVHFSYCFCLTLMHSLWQAALFLCMYTGFNAIVSKNNPVVKRNILFALLVAQVVLSVSTFVIYYTGAESFYTTYINDNFSGILANQPVFEKVAPWLIAAYTLVLLFKSVNLLYGWTRFKTNSKASLTRPSADLKLFTTLKAFQFGIRRKVTLWYSSTVHTPMTFGFFKPVILLPVALLNNLSLQETETLIIHELSHIKNNDYFLNWLLVICETIFFFNPFILILGNRIRMEREKNCDTQVLQFNYPAIDYAETLLKAATFKTTANPFFLAAATQKTTQLLNRIQFFTTEKNLRFHKRNYTGLAISLAAMFILFNLALLNIIRTKAAVADIALPRITESAITEPIENIAAHYTNAVIPLIEKAAEIAEEASKQAAKENLDAMAAAELAELAKTEAETHLADDETTPESIAVPVTMTESDDTKEITMKEESSATGKAVTKVYKMKFINGEWKMSLLWTITEKRIGLVKDSSIIVKDTSNYFNPVQ